MSESRSYSTSDASENPERIEVILSLPTVQKMLPLVRHIGADILAQNAAMKRLQPEATQLDRQKRELDWPARERRYQIKEELAAAEAGLQAARTELHELGLALLDETVSLIGFPTMVNNRRAFFSWHPGEEELHNWQFADEDLQRPIPAAWFKEIAVGANS